MTRTYRHVKETLPEHSLKGKVVLNSDVYRAGDTAFVPVIAIRLYGLQIGGRLRPRMALMEMRETLGLVLSFMLSIR